MSKRRVITDHDRDTPSPSPAPRVLGFKSAKTTTPIAHRSRGGPAGGSSRAKVDLSALDASSPSSASSPPLRRAPASTPFIPASTTFSPALRGVSASHASTSAPTTPRIGITTSASGSIRSASPNKQPPLRGSPFEHGEIPPNVTVRSSSKTNLAAIARSRTGTEGSGISNGAASSLASPTPSTNASGRASPVRMPGHARSNTLGRVPTASSLHATPTQARLAAAAVFSPHSNSSTSSPMSPPTSRPMSGVGQPHLQQRASSPSRPASPAGLNVLHGRHSASEGQEVSAAGQRLSRPPLAPSASLSSSMGTHHQRQQSISSTSANSVSGISAARSSVGSDTASTISKSPVSPSPIGGQASPPRSPPAIVAKVARPQQPQATVGGLSNAREQPSFGSAATATATGSNGFFDWAFSGSTGTPPVPPSTQSPTRPTPSSGSALLSPTTEQATPSAGPHFSLPIEYAQLRVERKIADLEITNRSLMAINSGLEVNKHRQFKEIRELKRRLARAENGSALALTSPGGSSATGTSGDSDDEDEDEDEEYFPTIGGGDDDAGLAGPPKEDKELEAAHQRCRALIDGMLAEAQEAILSVWPPVVPTLSTKSALVASTDGAEEKGGGGMKVLSVGEVHEREEEAARAEVDDDEADGLDDSLAGMGLSASASADNSGMTTLLTPRASSPPVPLLVNGEGQEPGASGLVAADSQSSLSDALPPLQPIELDYAQSAASSALQGDPSMSEAPLPSAISASPSGQDESANKEISSSAEVAEHQHQPSARANGVSNGVEYHLIRERLADMSLTDQNGADAAIPAPFATNAPREVDISEAGTASEVFLAPSSSPASPLAKTQGLPTPVQLVTSASPPSQRNGTAAAHDATGDVEERGAAEDVDADEDGGATPLIRDAKWLAPPDDATGESHTSMNGSASGDVSSEADESGASGESSVGDEGDGQGDWERYNDSGMAGSTTTPDISLD